MSNPPMLALPDFTKAFTMECDALGLGLGAALMQDQRPTAFHNQALKRRNLTFSTYGKELLALVVAVKKWRPYLLGKPFVIKTNYQSLKYLLKQRVGTPAQQMWITKLLDYAFIVKYKQGKENLVADDLSRRDGDLAATTEPFATTGGTFCIISFPTPTWLSNLKSSYATNPAIQKII